MAAHGSRVLASGGDGGLGKDIEGANIVFVVLMHSDMFVDLIVQGLTEAMGVAKK